MSKITLKEFKDLTDLFATYYSQKSDNREDGWIEKTFQKYPALKSIWKDFDKKIKDAENRIDKTAVPYLKKQGIDVSKLK
jgi:hypothetical protein